MKCLEFKRLALSDPNSKDVSYVEHSNSCPDCVKYVSGIRKMDADLSASIDVAIPNDLMARLQLNQELTEEAEEKTRGPVQRYAIAASVAVALLVGGLLVSNQLSFTQQIGDDYKSLLAAVYEHVDEQPFTPVWENARANQTVQTVLASYDSNIRLRDIENLNFGRICPMGKYRGLHASLQTDDGPVTFAYIKGQPVGELLNTSYEGYVTRVKPLRGGNLIIISRTTKSLEQADTELGEAMYWDI